MNEQWATEKVLTAEETEQIQRTFVVKVYGWMAAGLMITGATALFTLQVPAMLELIFSSRWSFMGLVFAQLGMVIWLSARVEKMTAATATMVFLGYSLITGLTLTVVFLLYTSESLASTFFVTAGTFGIMSSIGYLTRRDLTSFGSFLIMGLIGMVIASVANLWLNNETIYWITTYIGLFIFIGLTAYDTQKIKSMSLATLGNPEMEQKGAVMGALRLYLDFINIFLLLLRLMGNRK